VSLSGGAANADKKAAESCLGFWIFRKIIEVGFMAQKTYNADETGLFWNKESNRTYNSKEEKTVPGFEAAEIG
jgi:hypothetical protein